MKIEKVNLTKSNPKGGGPGVHVMAVSACETYIWENRCFYNTNAYYAYGNKHDNWNYVYSLFP